MAKAGHFVNTASMAGMNSGLGFSPYVASKFAVVGMSEGPATQLKPFGIGVSVLCPGYVRTRIGESGRNRPERYGATQTPDPASPAGLLLAQLAERLQSGLDPSDVAVRVLAAIREDELYVFTHPEMRAELEDRFAAIMAAMDKAAARCACVAFALIRGLSIAAGPTYCAVPPSKTTLDMRRWERWAGGGLDCT
jgi:short-subunit dehydrogenase